jgi:hypothetical protein
MAGAGGLPRRKLVAATDARKPDDRLLPETRWASLVIVAILVPAFVVLWVLPGRTADLWAWPIEPEMTSIFMGSIYGAGAYFFSRVALGRHWHPASAGVLSAAIFAALMLLVTLIHYERLNHGDAPLEAAVAFYAWVGVYIAAPLLVGGLWLRNRRTDSRQPRSGDPAVPLPARWIARAVSAIAGVIAALLLLFTSGAIEVWPWTLTPFTAQVLGCFAAQVALNAALLSIDNRWSSWRVLLQTFLVASVLLLTGTSRGWGDFDHANPGTWIFVAGVVGQALSILALYARMELRGPPAIRPGALDGDA